MVQGQVLDKIDSDQLAVHVVWTPVLRADDYEWAKKSQNLIPDERATHYWDGDQFLGSLYGKIVDLPMGREFAWDIYFAFDTGVEWHEEAPAPNAWVHQLGRDNQHLGDGSGLHEAVQGLLDS